MSVGRSHRSLKTLLRNAATITLFATGALHQIQTAEAAAYTLTSANSYTYTENFDGIASGLTTGWSVYSGATASSLGTAATPVTTATAWSTTTGQFKNVAAIDTVATTATSTVQAAATDRALGLQVTAAFGDPGAAFAFNFNSTGMKFAGNSTALSFKMLMDSVQTRSQVYTIQYATGASPTSFTDLGTWSDPGVLGSTTLTFTGSQLSALSEQANAWIRIISGTSTGSGSRDGVALDDFTLTYASSVLTGNYWVGGNSAWSSSSTSFSTTSGGSTGAAQATTGALIFDASSGFTGSPAITVNNTVNVEAGLTFDVNGLTISPGTGTPLMNFNGASASTNLITVNSTYTTTFSVKLTGSNGLTKAGTGKLILTGDNSGLTGAVTLSNGTLRGTSTSALGAGTLVLGGGTLELATNLGASFGRNTTVSGDVTIKSDVGVAGSGATQTLGTLSMGGQTLTIDKGSNVNSGTAAIAFGATTLTGAPTFTVNTGSLLTLTSINGAGQNITINGAGDTTVSGAITTTTGSLTKSGNGTLKLNGANTFTGGLTINAGTVSLGSTSALNSTAGSQNAVVFGSGSTGTLSLNSNNATIASLNTNATAGTTFVQNGGASNATLTIGNSTNADSTYAGTIQNGSSGTLAINKSGTGTLTLTSANTYTGGTNINQGKILLSGGSLSSGTVAVANGATLAVSGVASAGSLSLVSGANLDLTLAGFSLTDGLTASGGNISYTLGNTLAVTGALNLSGTVNISLSGAFTKGTFDLLTFASGDTTALNITTTRLGWTITPVITSTKYSLDIAVASSDLNWDLSSDGTWDTSTSNWFNSKSSSTATFADGDNVTFDKSTGGIITISGTVSPATTTVNSSGDYTFQSGSIAGDGGITKSGNGKLTLSAANTFTGEVVVNAGTLAVTQANALGSTSTGTRIISGATLDLSNNITLSVEPLTLSGTGVGGFGALTSSSGANTVSGPITLSSNTLISALGTTGIDLLTLSGALSGSGSTLSIGGSADTTISGNISGTGLAINKVDDGVLTLSGASNNYTGGTTISGGKLIAGTSNLTGNIIDDAILQIDQSTDGTYAGNISGSGLLIKEGTGAVTLSGTNTVGRIMVDAGTLVIASPTALSTSGTLTLIGGSLLTLSTAGTYGASTQTIDLGPTNDTFPAMNIGSGTAVTLASNLVISSQSQIAVPGAGGVLTLSGVLSGNGKLVKSDLGKIIISGTNNNFTGSTEVQNGTLTLNAGSSLGTGTLTMSAQGGVSTLELNESISASSLISGASPTGSSTITLASGKTLTVNETSTRTFGTTVGSSTFTINGAGGLTMAGTGELILDSTNSYTGLTSVTAGTLTANNSAAISSSASVSSGAVLNLQDNKTLTSLAGSGEVRIADGKTFTLNNSTTQNFGGIFTANTGTAFTKSGNGTLNLSGSSVNLARDITLSAGTVKASNNSALGTGTVLIGTGGSGTTGTLYVAKDKTISNNITIGTVAAKGTTTSSKLTLLSFNLNGNTGAGVSPYVTTGTKNAAITSFTGLTRGTGAGTPTGSLPASAWAASNMTATSAAAAVTANQYVTFGFKSTTSGFTLDTSLILPYINYRSGSGSDQVQWAYKINNGSYTDLGGIQLVGTSATTPTTVTPTLANDITLAAGDEITFRLAIFKVTTTGGGNWYLKDNTNTVDDIGIQGYVVTAYDNPAFGSGVLGIDETGTATFTGNVVVNNTAELTATTGGTAIFKTGVISGLGSLTKTGNGTVELQGDNTFTGSLTLSAGNLKVSTLGAGGVASPLGAAADSTTSIIFNGGKLEYAGSGETLTRDFTVGNGGAGFIASGTGALVIGQDAQMDFDNATASNRTLSLGGTTDIAVENIFNPKKFDTNDINNLFTKLVKQDVNKWVVLGAGAGFVDADTTEMNVDGGELDFAMGSLGSSAHKAHINVGSATLGWYNGNTEDLSGRIYLNNSATAAFNVSTGTVTLANALNGGLSTTASLTKLGAGTLELGAENKFSGGFNISAGTVKATIAGALGSGTVNISRNATLVVNTILANKINVTAGATLAGNGTDNDATIEEDGILSPNADNIGTLSFNKLTLNGGSHVKWQLQDATGAAGVGYDTLVVSVINLNNAISTKKKIHVDVTSTGSFLHFDKTKLNQFKFASLTTALADGVNVTDLFSIDASQFEIDNNLTDNHLVWSMQVSADRDMLYVTTMIPEPSTYGLGLSALALATVAIRRRKKKKN